jgi:hypothetical protein
MKIFVTTSNNYHHILPIFFYLYGKYWRDPMTLIGYDKPNMELPDYCTWLSLGKQGTKYEFASDMRRAFKDEKEPFVWMMEDTFIRKPIDRKRLDICKQIAFEHVYVGRISLTDNSYKYYTEIQTIWYSLGGRTTGGMVEKTPDDSDYRLSLQPAIWHPDYLNKHLKDGMSPWMFENQNGTLMTFKEDQFINIKLGRSPLVSNEGIRRHDLYRYDFTGFCEEDIIHLKKLGYQHNPWTR